MTETGWFSLNSILSAVLFASRACIGMFLINIKFMFRPNIQCERNRKNNNTSSHANASSHCEITETTFPAHFSSEGWRTVRVSHVAIAKLLEDWIVNWVQYCDQYQICQVCSCLKLTKDALLLTKTLVRPFEWSRYIRQHRQCQGILLIEPILKRLPFLYVSNCSMFFKDIGGKKI